MICWEEVKEVRKMVWRNGGCGSHLGAKTHGRTGGIGLRRPGKTWSDLVGYVLLLNWQLRNTHLVNLQGYRNLGLEPSVHTGEQYKGTASTAQISLKICHST